MDLTYTAEEEAFRSEVAAWLKANAPGAHERGNVDALRAWQKRLYAAGYLGAGWPVEFGGAGLTGMQQAILNEELARANAPAPINAMAIWWVGPAIIKYGTDAQRQRFLAPILAADEIWATGYSEPGSGSDMAAAKCRAVRDGDTYVVNGQKVWTTLAHISDWYFILVRTATEGPKWAGLSLLLIDMKSPGISVRPIITLDEEHEVNETFFDNVKVPAQNLVGEEGKGWTYAKFLLGHERTGIARVGESKRELE